MFSPSQSSTQQSLMECLKLKICTNNRLLKFLYDKIVNIDLKSILLEKSLDKLEEDEMLRINAQINGSSYVLECKLIDKTIVIAEPFNFNALIDLDPMDYTNLIPTIQTIGDINVSGQNEHHEKLSSSKSCRIIDEDFPKRLHTSSSSGSNMSAFGASNLLPSVTMTVDEVTSQKLDKLIDQNDKIMNLLSNIDKKHDLLIKQNEKIIENQSKHDHILENFSNFLINHTESTPTRNMSRQSFSNPPSVQIKPTDYQQEFQPIGQCIKHPDNAVFSMDQSIQKNEMDYSSTVQKQYEFMDSNATTASTLNTTQGNTSISYEEEEDNEDNDDDDDDDEESDDGDNNKNYEYASNYQNSNIDPTSNFDPHIMPSTSVVNQQAIKAKKKKNNKGFEITQKEFNRKMKANMLQIIPQEDLHLGMMELCEKYPEKINQIKMSLKNFLPKGSTFNTAWSKALHSIRQQKYMERKKK